jgi:hypothetical protein
VQTAGVMVRNSSSSDDVHGALKQTQNTYFNEQEHEGSTPLTQIFRVTLPLEQLHTNFAKLHIVQHLGDMNAGRRHY